MKTLLRCGWVAALCLSMVSLTAFASAQDRLANSPQSEAVLNAQSSGFISTPSGGEAVTDGSFEAGSPNPNWNEASLNFGTPLCSEGTCGTGGGTAFPNTGDWWAWFGGIGFVHEEGSVDQNVTFPSGSATLSFYFGATVCQGNPSDYLEVLVDGNQEWVFNGTDPLCNFIAYTQQFVDLTAYADGGVHNVEFHSETFAGSTTNLIVDDVSLVSGEPPALARFLVTKDFNDGNEAEVEVTLTCNTGLPLQQHWDISEGDPVNFVVGDFNQGELNCEVTEEGVDGYTASYNDGTVSATECSWEDLEGGQYGCAITNSLNQVEVEVDKVWIDEKPEFEAQNVAEAYWSCSNVAWGSSGGYLQFYGNPGSDSFWVYPDWESGTTCSITEVGLLESGIEVDDSDCQGMVLWPDVGDTCTIYNTRLYEGIPTLSQYGLALLAMLMLGLGFVAYRRLV